jgi:hypothetical protein
MKVVAKLIRSLWFAALLAFFGQGFAARYGDQRLS